MIGELEKYSSWNELMLVLHTNCKYEAATNTFFFESTLKIEKNLYGKKNGKNEETLILITNDLQYFFLNIIMYYVLDFFFIILC